MSSTSNIHILPLIILSTSLSCISASASASPFPSPSPSPSPYSTSTSTSTSTGTHHINGTNSTDEHTNINHTLDTTAQIDLMIGIGLGVILLVVSFLLIYRYALRPRSYILSSPPQVPSSSLSSSSSSCSQSSHVIDLEQPFLDNHNQNQDDVALQITPNHSQ